MKRFSKEKNKQSHVLKKEKHELKQILSFKCSKNSTDFKKGGKYLYLYNNFISYNCLALGLLLPISLLYKNIKNISFKPPVRSTLTLFRSTTQTVKVHFQHGGQGASRAWQTHLSHRRKAENFSPFRRFQNRRAGSEARQHRRKNQQKEPTTRRFEGLLNQLISVSTAPWLRSRRWAASGQARP